MTYRCLFIHLRAEMPALELVDLDERDSSVQSSAGNYSWATSTGIATDFYDWLRNPAGELIGARIYPFDLKAAFFIRAAAALDYCRVAKPALEIFFGAPQQYDQELSTILDIAPCALWRSSDDPSRFACSIPTMLLSKEDIGRLMGKTGDRKP